MVMFKTRFTTICFTQGVLMAAMIASAAQANQVGNVEIRIWDQATVTHPELRLDDIATFSGPEEDLAALRRFVISSSLMENQPIILRAWDIARRLSEAGFDASAIKVTGAARCEVNFVLPKDKKNDQVKKSDNTVTLSQAARLAGPATLETKVRQLICDRLSEKGLSKEAKILINFNPVLTELLSMTEPPYRFVISPQQRTTAWTGLVGLDVKIYRENAFIQAVPMLVQVQVKVPVIIANKTINSKARITRDDVKVTFKEINQASAKTIVDLSSIQDCQAKRLISPGSIITSDMIESVPLVRRNQLVTVIYHKAGLEIKLVGKALDDAGRNEFVKVRNERSKEIFNAKVIGEGSVVVESGMAGIVPAGARKTEGSL